MQIEDVTVDDHFNRRVWWAVAQVFGIGAVAAYVGAYAASEYCRRRRVRHRQKGD